MKNFFNKSLFFVIAALSQGAQAPHSIFHEVHYTSVEDAIQRTNDKALEIFNSPGLSADSKQHYVTALDSIQSALDADLNSTDAERRTRTCTTDYMSPGGIQRITEYIFIKPDGSTWNNEDINKLKATIHEIRTQCTGLWGI